MDKRRDLIIAMVESMEGSLEDKPNRTPTHGSCCTCQTCGYHYDDCVCSRREWIKKIDQAIVELDALELTIDELNVVITDVMGAEWNDVAVALLQARDRKRGGE